MVSLFRSPDTLPPIASIGRFQSGSGIAGGMWPHSHPKAVEVCYIEHGVVEWWSGSDVHELRPEDVLVTLPRVSHGAVESAVSPCSYLWVHFDPTYLSEELQASFALPETGGHHHKSPEIGALLTSMLAEHGARDSLSAANCSALITTLAISLLRMVGKRDDLKVSRLVVDAQKLLLENDRVGCVSNVADSLRISEVSLNKRFRQEVGETPAAWVRSRKIDSAKRLLCMTSDSVTEIGYHLGFKSSQYFATTFKRVTGFSPTDYRLLHQGPMISRVELQEGNLNR